MEEEIEITEEMLEERETSPCRDCTRADWIDMYGKIIWGCDMSRCIMDPNEIEY